MDLNVILAWIAGVSSVVMIVNVLRSPSRPWGWAGVGLFVLAAMGGAALLADGLAGWVGGGLWALLMLAPSLAFSVLARASMRQQYPRAIAWSRLLRLLHPFDGYWEMPSFYTALAAELRGDVPAAMQYFTQCVRTQCPIGYMAQVHLFRICGEWEHLLIWLRVQAPAGVLERDLSLMALYLRALGETGNLSGLLDAFQRYRAIIMKADPYSLDLIALMVFAFSGRRQGVELVLNGALSGYPPALRQFWSDTADLVQGDPHARARLTALTERDNHIVRIAAERRLTTPLADPQEALTPAQTAARDNLYAELAREAHYRAQPRELARAYVTYTLIGVNMLVFLGETLLGGSTNLQTLVRMGAAVTALVLDGAWWRLIAAGFLHYGWLHLTMNMLALFIFGRILETRLGHGRFLLVYLLAGLGAVWMALLPFTIPDQTVVGASGSIMALLGAFAATSLIGWRREHARTARAQWHFALFIIAAQALFDLFIPEVSGIAHLSGALFGFALTLLLVRQRRQTAA